MLNTRAFGPGQQKANVIANLLTDPAYHPSLSNPTHFGGKAQF